MSPTSPVATLLERDDIASALRDIAAALRIGGESKFRIAAYERGADALAAFNGDLDLAIAENKLTAIPGVGEKLAALIVELRQTGRAELLDKLTADLPPGALALARGPSLSAKAIATLSAAHIRDLEALREAAAAGRLRDLPGFSAKTEARILRELDEQKESAGQILLAHALAVAAEVTEFLRAPGVLVETVGEVRRGLEVVSVVDLLATAANDADLDAARARFASFHKVIAHSEVAGVTLLRLVDGTLVRLFTAPTDQRGSALQRLTGPDEHNAAIAEAAGRAKIALDGFLAADEATLYERIGLQLIPPPLRDHPDALAQAAAGTLPRLVELGDIRGMVHCHTTYSDGKNSIEEMARAAQARGIDYLTITDHSPTAHYARGVELDRLRRQWDEIARVQESVEIRLLRGTESDILKDGGLDYPDEILEQLDVVIASVHNRYALDEAAMTARLETAMRQPYFKIWGHALGRILLSRPPVACDVDRVLDACAESRVAIEINGDPHRLDLAPELARRAHARGIPFVLSVDAHSTANFDYLRYATLMAQRAGLTAADILNTRNAAGFAAAVKPTA